MTAGLWSRTLRAAPFAVGLFGALPLPVPLPSVPVQLAISVPSPSIPAVIPSATSQATIAPASTPVATASTGAAPAPQQTAVATPVTHAGETKANPSRGIEIPFTTVYISSPLDVALIGALVTLPLLLGIWLFLFLRTLAEARRARDAQTRLALAADLGFRPRDVISMSTSALFSLREKAAFDELTGVLRRAAGIGAAEREIARARRHKAPLTVAFVDVDGLKEANDRKGHATGDALLRSLAQALKDGLRGEDVVFRYGGDEFVCVLPDTTVKDARLKMSEIQAAAAKHRIRFCAGLAELQRSDDVVSLFARADRDLYEFKANRGAIVHLRPSPERKRPDSGVTASRLDSSG